MTNSTMTTEDFEKNPKLDGYLIMVLGMPNREYILVDYDPIGKKVGVYVESSASQIPNLTLIEPGIYSGRVELASVLELIKREDVTMIRAMKK